jgi:hypothetical protein
MLFPIGPTCIFEGKEVPTFVCCTENGSINSFLMAAMLNRIDDLGVFPRDKILPDPFLLLDGHSSRFNLSFLELVNDKKHHRWTCVGTPYGTNKWQLGDSEQQNGTFNIEMSKDKKERLADKVKNRFPFKLTKEDITWRTRTRSCNRLGSD